VAGVVVIKASMGVAVPVAVVFLIASATARVSRLVVRIGVIVIVVIAKASLYRSVELRVGEVASSGFEDVIQLVGPILRVVRFHREETTRQDFPVVVMESPEEFRIAVFVGELLRGLERVG